MAIINNNLYADLGVAAIPRQLNYSNYFNLFYLHDVYGYPSLIHFFKLNLIQS